MGTVNHYDVSTTTGASAAKVYGLLLDGSTWPRWSAIDSWAPGAPDAEGGGAHAATSGPVGQVREFRTGRNVSREEIVEAVPDRRMVYAMLDGSGLLPGYRGQVDLEPQPGGGTRIRWRATWRSRLPGVDWLMERYLSRFQLRMVQGLARYAEAA